MNSKGDYVNQLYISKTTKFCFNEKYLFLLSATTCRVNCNVWPFHKKGIKRGHLNLIEKFRHSQRTLSEVSTLTKDFVNQRSMNV